MPARSKSSVSITDAVPHLRVLFGRDSARSTALRSIPRLVPSVPPCDSAPTGHVWARAWAQADAAVRDGLAQNAPASVEGIFNDELNDAYLLWSHRVPGITPAQRSHLDELIRPRLLWEAGISIVIGLLPLDRPFTYNIGDGAALADTGIVDSSDRFIDLLEDLIEQRLSD